MKQLLIIISLSLTTAQLSCTTTATSADVNSTAVEEITITRNVDTEFFNDYLKTNEKAVLVDVRTAGEVAQGYIEGAKHIDINSQAFRTEIDKLDKTQPTLVYCRSGRRSAAAMRYMRDIGFSEVYNLNGGIIAWSQAGLPLVK